MSLRTMFHECDCRKFCRRKIDIYYSKNQIGASGRLCVFLHFVFFFFFENGAEKRGRSEKERDAKFRPRSISNSGVSIERRSEFGITSGSFRSCTPPLFTRESAEQNGTNKHGAHPRYEGEKKCNEIRKVHMIIEFPFDDIAFLSARAKK